MLQRIWLFSACLVFLVCVIWMAVEWMAPGLLIEGASVQLWQNASGFHALSGAALFLSAPFIAGRISRATWIGTAGYAAVALAIVTFLAALWASFAVSPSIVLLDQKPPPEIVAVRTGSRAIFKYLPVIMLVLSWVAVSQRLKSGQGALLLALASVLSVPAFMAFTPTLSVFSDTASFMGLQFAVAMSHSLWYGPAVIAWVALLCVWVMRGQPHWGPMAALCLPAVCLILALNTLAQLGLQGMPSGYPDFPRAFARNTLDVSVYMIAFATSLALPVALACLVRSRLGPEETDVFL